jgi:hypothetical protein
MSLAVWNGPYEIVTIANGATNSSTFSMPEQCLGVTFIFPTLTNALKVQVMTPKLGDQDADAFTDLSITATQGVAGAVTNYTMSGFATGTAVAMDAGLLGGAGAFRFVSAGAEGGARTIYVLWRVDRSRR